MGKQNRSSSASENPLLKVEGLSVAFQTEQGLLRAVDDVSFTVQAGKTLGIVGESGCGKSVTSLSIMRLIPSPPGQIEKGQVLFDGKSLLELSWEEMRTIRGNKIAMIFQEPMVALNPVLTIGHQVSEAILLHRKVSKEEAKTLAIEMLKRVGISAAAERYRDYPHQMSGGMRQRAMIAMALSCRPQLLIADEPTTALDVTIQAQILELLKELQRAVGMGLILISHDLGVIAEMADDVLVMYAGRVVEQGSVREIFKNPRHPYTQALLASLPKLEGPRGNRLTTIPGIVPNLQDLPRGCRFQERCAHVISECRGEEPLLREVQANWGPAHGIRCIREIEVKPS